MPPRTSNPKFTFNGSSHSVPLRDIHDIRFDPSGARPRKGKPVQAYFTQGLQIVGVPAPLLLLLPPRYLDGINLREMESGARMVTSVHIETPEAIHLLRVENRVVMAYPE